MEVYHRIVSCVRGAMWAHHRRLMPERQFHRILGYVYNNKYEHQIRLDKMSVVGREWDGKVEVVMTPAGHITRVRVNPSFQDLPVAQQKSLLVAAYGDAAKQGRAIMEETELRIYKQFLRDLKPIVMGIRDTPEFYTVPEGSVEMPGGVLRSSDAFTNDVGSMMEGTHSSAISSSSYLATPAVQRTIPYASAQLPSQVVENKNWAIDYVIKTMPYYTHTPQFAKLSAMTPENRKRGAPGAKKTVLPLHYPVPYIAMDEARLARKNWVAFLDNKHIAEVAWTRGEVGIRERKKRELRRAGLVWHGPVNEGVSRR